LTDERSVLVAVVCHPVGVLCNGNTVFIPSWLIFGPPVRVLDVITKSVYAQKRTYVLNVTTYNAAEIHNSFPRPHLYLICQSYVQL